MGVSLELSCHWQETFASGRKVPVINLIIIKLITGTFLPLAKVFKIDQYVLALVLGLTNFAANLL